MNLFDDVDASDVFGALTTFYRKRGAKLIHDESRDCYQLYRRQGRWCALEWDSGWEWKERREAQVFVSKQLHALGLLAFVYDGLYWGYELFRQGEVLDRFVQSANDATRLVR